MESQSQMMNNASSSSSPSISAVAESDKSWRFMGMWLRLSPPSIHLCKICKMCFQSMKALSRHQNAHRRQARLNRLRHMHIMRIYYRHMHREKLLQELIRKVTSSSSSINKRARNNNANRNEIDLQLRLEAPKLKVTNFYDFLGVVKENTNNGVNKINDADGHEDDKDGVNEAIVDVDEYERDFDGGNENSIVVDLTLKL